MSVLDFLFEGRAPQSVTTYGETVENVPTWMSDYTQGLIARANAVAAEPYQAYGGPRIAGFDPAQQQSFNLIEGNIGKYDPYIEGAEAGIQKGMGHSPLSAAQPYMDEATGAFPGAVDKYMDPYIQNVLDRQETLAGRTLTEEFLPALQKSFVGAGAFGSRGEDSMEELGIRGVRDIQEGLEEQRLASLSGAYGQAADIYGKDKGRQAQMAILAGDLDSRGADISFQGARQLGALGQMAQQMGGVEAANLSAIGADRQRLSQQSLDLAYQDFLRQQGYPQDQIGFLSNTIRGLPYTRSTTTSDTGPASIYQPSGLSQLVGAYGVYKGFEDQQKEAKGGLIRAQNVIDLPREDYRVIDEAAYA